ncbi:GNAT family N-acetyltransferase [Salinibacterium sp. NG253]|uniref:GNAT family N-acetyltransferase n=1 Tax=Salinibacterium sp. NG253 TaxID=2792039 RepID=UPI0018CF5232|nr:GNAT family N-acetyltransferase [Salinibacterium sp. NG253]MBH0117026.1 GNAT family N-acetyltransferase [Salinibacterium sp. NG253]
MNPRTRSTPIDVRPYRPADAAPTLAVFLSAVTITASADYSPQQIAAWARADEREIPVWDQSMSARNSFVALVDGEIAGFSDVSSDGYIDMMFVSPQHSRQGVAAALLDFIEVIARERASPSLSANVSVTARPFFEKRGFQVEAEQHPVLNGVELNNFTMTKSLDASPLAGQVTGQSQGSEQ